MAQFFTPGLKAFCVLDGVPLPIQPGSAMRMPLNLQAPQTFTSLNMWQFVTVTGLQFPTVDLNMYVTKNVLSKTLMEKWFCRDGDTQDVVSAGEIYFWDGAKGVHATVSKVASMSISGAFGDMLRIRMTLLCGGTINPAFDGVTGVTPEPILEGLCNFSHISFDGELASSAGTENATRLNMASSFELMLNNNLDVSPELNGTVYPLEHNAGQLTCTCRIVQQGRATRPRDGYSFGIAITTPDLVQGGAKITIVNPMCVAPHEHAVQFPRTMREYNYIALAGLNVGTLTIPVTFDDMPEV